MRPHVMITVAASLALALAGTAAQAGGYRPPRNALGQPDLSGLWTNSSLTMLQRPPIFKALVATDAEAAMMEAGFKKLVGDIVSTGPVDPAAPAPAVVKEAPQADFLEMDLHLARIDGQMRSSWIVEPADGRLPFTDAGRKAAKDANAETFDGPEGRPLSERCLTAVGSPEGPPMMNSGFNANYLITQSPGYVTIEIEMNHDLRVIRMDDRRHIPAAMRPWLGDSVGWWEGDTLVVETTNLHDTYVSSLGGGFAYSPQGRLTERFTRTAKDRLLYEFTVDDPAMFKQAWRAQMPMRPAAGPIYEYACHEGNYSLANALSGARAEERVAAAAPTTSKPTETKP
ncbi:MAG: hypothetical protein JF588_15540 [Caulobacterales bacterium]|nr:hypothetical protein [Caulobacterales bacterium]